MPRERYFQPSSATMKTTLPSSSSPAIRTATRAIAPDETPAKSCSSSSSLRVQTIASLVGHEDLAVEQREVDDRRDEAVVERAQALHRLALHRLGGDDLDRVAELLLEPAAVAHQRAAGAEAGDERADLVELLEDLERRAVVVRVAGWPGCRTGRACSSEESAAAMSSASSTAPLEPLAALRVDDLGAVHAQQLGALGRDVVGHHDLQRVALVGADHRQRDAGVARGRLEDRLARADRALVLGVLDQRARDAVLDRAGRVARLELGPDPHARLRARAA